MQNVSIKGFIYAALSSATFGLAPFFTISLLLAGFSSFEVLAYRWGIASLALVVFGIMLGETFRISRKDWGTVFILSHRADCCRSVRILLWRIYRRSKEEPCRADSLHCIDMLRNGAGSLVLYYRRISDRRHPAGQ